MSTRHDLIHKAAALPVGDPERKRFLAQARDAAGGLQFKPIERAVTKYRVDHPEYGKFDLSNNSDGTGWYMVVVDPTPAFSLRRNKIIPKVSFAPLGDAFLPVLRAHVEAKLAKFASR